MIVDGRPFKGTPIHASASLESAAQFALSAALSHRCAGAIASMRTQSAALSHRRAALLGPSAPRERSRPQTRNPPPPPPHAHTKQTRALPPPNKPAPAVVLLRPCLCAAPPLPWCFSVPWCFLRPCRGASPPFPWCFLCPCLSILRPCRGAGGPGHAHTQRQAHATPTRIQANTRARGLAAVAGREDAGLRL